MWDKKEDAPERFKTQDRLELTGDFKNLTPKELSIREEPDEIQLPPKLMTIVRALEILTGREIDLSFAKSIKPQEPSSNKDGVQEGERELLGWGIDYQYQKTEIKKEQLAFSVSGSVKSADGKSIDFSLAFNIKSEISLHESLSFKAGDAVIDPLVINFGTDVVSISDIKHNFDLDLDGKSDEFSFVGSGSGFLALDKNSDGIINDGSELFGPKSGNGFNELRAYDSDRNGWIDESDEAFSKLLIWSKDENGVESLYSLKEKNIGALYLGSVKTDFEFIGADAKTTAHLRESSIYLREDGGIGILQELDLVV
ncbi:hypothetical protein M947_06270 [Sulfurimonas hongkongensis]|uniref:VCBS repeat-containing protein n=2 Tax=Sulfurimonas hongkongensis TaxID=1172190 RepID=T0JEZ5_9BACT|nr:hypothetical protein M947_06270 [Sulfurimonas hongkongensis]